MREDLPLLNAIDIEIVMHRDVHFGGDFPTMLAYYKKKGIGAMPDFPLHRIKALASYEKRAGSNLSETLLPLPEQEKVEEAKNLYFSLREVYATSPPALLSILISDLILTEDEDPIEEIKKIVAQGEEIVPLLIHLLHSASFYDPLYPGYGRAPLLAARCLAQIGDPRALPSLFEGLGQDNFYTDEEIIKSLRQFGTVARDFLLKILSHKPYSRDNEHAAIALGSFPEDPLIATACLRILQETVPPFAPYLIFGCASLASSEEKESFRHLSKDSRFSKELAEEMNLIIKSWK